MPEPQAFESVVIYEATEGEWPFIVKRWYSVFGNVEPVCDRSIYGFDDLDAARAWIAMNFPRFERALLPPVDQYAIEKYMSPESIRHMRVYAPVLQRTVEIVSGEDGVTFGEAYQRALAERKMQGLIPPEIERAILTAAFRVVTHKAFPPAGIRAVMTQADCIVCGAPWDATGPTCSCSH